MSEDQEWWTISQAAKRLGVNPATLREWCDRDYIRHFRTPGGRRLFDPAEIERFAAARQRGPGMGKLAA